MFARLLILFIIIPLLELLVIIQIGSRIGYLYTILLLVLISFSGAALAKREGYEAVSQIRSAVAAGHMPTDSLIDGGLILTAAALLITPGYLTDAAGLALLTPPVRRLVRIYVRRRLKKAVAAQTVHFWTSGQPPEASGGAPREPEQRRKEIDR